MRNYSIADCGLRNLNLIIEIGKYSEMLLNAGVIRNEAGWSLPLTWIILIIIGVLTYFLGWIVILFVLAACGSITLGTYIHDKIKDSPSR